MVNHYLLLLSRFGLVGLVPFLALNITAIKKLVDSYKASIYSSDKWLVWCLSAGLLGSAAAILSIALWGPPLTIYYMIVGFCGVMPAVITKNRARARLAVSDQTGAAI